VAWKVANLPAGIGCPFDRPVICPGRRANLGDADLIVERADTEQHIEFGAEPCPVVPEGGLEPGQDFVGVEKANSAARKMFS